MTTETFDAAIDRAAKQPYHDVEDIKRTQFARPLAELKELQRTWPKQHTLLLNRLAIVKDRVHKALTVGANQQAVHRLVVPLVRDLDGDAQGTVGLLPSIGAQIDRGIHNMESFGPKELPHRGWWISWPAEPDRVRDCLAAADDRLTQLEATVQDGGALQALVEEARARRASTPGYPAAPTVSE